MAILSEMCSDQAIDPTKSDVSKEQILSEHSEISPHNRVEASHLPQEQQESVSRVRAFKPFLKRLAKKTKEALTSFSPRKKRDMPRGYIPFSEFEAIYEAKHRDETIQLPKPDDEKGQSTPLPSLEIHGGSQGVSENEILNMEPGHVRKLVIWLERNGPMKNSARRELSADSAIPSVSTIAQNKGDLSKQRNHVEKVSSSLSSKSDDELPDSGARSSTRSLTTAEDGKTKAEVEFAPSTERVEDAKKKTPQELEIPEPFDAEEPKELELPKPAEESPNTCNGNAESNLLGAAERCEELGTFQCWTADVPVEKATKEVEPTSANVHTKGEVCAGNISVDVNIEKTAEQSRAERIQIRRERLRNRRQERKQRKLPVGEPSEIQETARFTPLREPDAHDAVCSEKNSAIKEQANGGSPRVINAARFEPPEEGMPHGVNGEMQPSEPRDETARATDPQNERPTVAVEREEGTSPGDTVGFFSGKEQWAREMAIRAAEVRKTSRKERLLSLLTRSLEEA